jgi:acetyl esterase/lipase
MGFSAGGHLASTLGTQYNTPINFVAGSIDTLSAKPDFIILVYPVITMDSKVTHGGSRNNLLGLNPSDELVTMFSNEHNINSDTPPTFLLHSSDDNAVPVGNSIKFYENLVQHGVPAEMHIFPFGGHGYALAIGKGQLAAWPEILHRWLVNLLIK